MEIFRNDEQGYFDWIAKHPDGFVLNSERKPVPRYLVLHTASCGHISGHTKNYARNASTGRNYIKICSESIQEIEVWTLSIGAAQFSAICKDCQPAANLKIIDSVSEKTRKEPAGNSRPKATLTQTLVYVRNQEIVQAVLQRASGVCERCSSQAPFKRKSNNQPYLEVHHTTPLSEGGEDTLDNTEALCHKL